MDVLVTGGAGFVGSHLAEALLDDGHTVTVLDNLDPYYDVRNPKPEPRALYDGEWRPIHVRPALDHRRVGLNDLAEYVTEQTDADVEVEHQAAEQGDARHTHADNSKAIELIGYEPTTGIREGVATFVEWYEANRDWYEPLVVSS
jgi:nucleoside-diphosphate-sugar epimerase